MPLSDTEAVKAAKKLLKKQTEPMKLRTLAKAVIEKVDNGTDSSVKEVQAWIQKSEKFIVDDKKIVSLKRKRSESPKDPQEECEKASKHAKMETSQKASSTGSAALLQDATSVAGWRKQNKIVVMHTKDNEEGKEQTALLVKAKMYFPYTSFEHPDCVASIVAPLLEQCVSVNKFKAPSPIQAQSWPILTQPSDSTGRKRDIVGIAETGSGKTLAFSLPILSAMSEKKVSGRRLPRLLVLSPTRELAMQSDQVLQEFGEVVGLKSLVVYGGVPKPTQTSVLKKGYVDCIVATPGRLKDLIHEGSCDLSAVDFLVLDEADRMLDMGFEEDVREIISYCKSKDEGRQTAMFSATWPAAIQNIALEYMVDPVRVYVGFESIVGSNGDNAVDDSLSANKRVTQTVEVIEDRQREARLQQILEKVHGKRNNRVLIFALYKKEAERLENSLRRQGWNCCSIHGNKTQAARTAALAEFKDGTCPLLVATDVAARGLDIPNVEAVINYTFPLTIEDYVHRIGRTGRAGKHGVSYTFFQPTDKSHAGELQQVMKQAGQEVPEELLKFGSTIKKKEHKLYGNFGPKDASTMKKATRIVFD
ncbi:ATP-dependent RNA helicase DBP3 [Fistulifera solaris]|uniref:RNA helicase n=1 Tax=Fistulifera solaris TaxID=1519565 RepID=A0A1Z5K3L6_FISSO|nr:ATP-dependent RNA helicase DBP3 [Fistulifera solaris]|eukprot:GAX20815.1 ATP-dependent RNA helicase DBP3 [Fistulifera solaris]